MSYLKYIIFLITLSMISTCIDDAAHDNPLDPINGSRKFRISGQVQTFYEPRQPIAGAQIRVVPGNQIVITDEDGQYLVQNLGSGEYSLICTAQGYSESVHMVIVVEDINHSFLLDGLPQFENISIKTHHRSRWFPADEVYYLELTAKVSDPDGAGDIDLVLYEIREFNFTDTLETGTDAGVFSKLLPGPDLPVESIHQLIGKEIDFLVKDDFGVITNSDPHYLTRIIDQTPDLLSPVELERVQSGNIHFVWNRVFVPYQASLAIEIFQINLGVAFKIDTIKNIPLSSTENTYTKNLPSGDYYWTLLIVDEFGNSSSSREGVFQVE